MPFLGFPRLLTRDDSYLSTHLATSLAPPVTAARIFGADPSCHAGIRARSSVVRSVQTPPRTSRAVADALSRPTSPLARDAEEGDVTHPSPHRAPSVSALLLRAAPPPARSRHRDRVRRLRVVVQTLAGPVPCAGQRVLDEAARPAAVRSPATNGRVRARVRGRVRQESRGSSPLAFPIAPSAFRERE